MKLKESVHQAYVEILREELVPAMGCTEPIAIAYGAAIVRKVLGQIPQRIEISLSGNIIKNVKSVVVPATGGMHGIPAAVGAGIISGCPEKKLEVLSALSPEDAERIREFLQNCPIGIFETDSGHIFECRLKAYHGDDLAETCILDRHTNVEYVRKNDKILWKNQESENGEKAGSGRADRSLLNVEDIVKFADEADLGQVEELLERQISYNMAIAREGLKGRYGASVGRTIYGDGNISLSQKAKAFAAAGSDARMNGCELPVCIISGSGNQGITASVPVVVYAREQNIEREKMLRALLVSDLVTIHQKSGIGCLSAYCGAVSAGCGCGAGIAYLMGGGYREIAHTLVNAVAVLSGTICDGAKSSCAAKISMAVEAGILGYEMYRNGCQFMDGEGIVKKGVENTLENIGKLARVGMRDTDKEIIKMMLE